MKINLLEAWMKRRILETFTDICRVTDMARTSPAVGQFVIKCEDGSQIRVTIVKEEAE